MKVLFVSNLIGMYSGGHTRNIVFLAEKIHNLGHDVEFFVHHQVGNININIPVYYSNNKKYNIKRFSREVSNFIQNRNYDIIHSNGAVNYKYFITKNTIPTIFHARSHNFINFFASILNLSTHLSFNYRVAFGSLYEYWFDLKYLSNKSYVLANCNDVMNRLLGDPLQNINMIYVSRNGINLPLTQAEKCFDPSLVHFGYLASFYPLKSWDYLLLIINEVVKRKQNVQFHIAGDGVLYDYVLKKSIRLGIEKYMKFYGRLKSEEEKISFFSSFDFFLVPSHCPTTVTEALSFAKPVIHFGRWFDCADGMDLAPFVTERWAISYRDMKPRAAASIIESVTREMFNSDKIALYKILNELYSWNSIAVDTETFYNSVMEDFNETKRL